MNRKLSVDVIKITMALCVVAIHANPLEAMADRGAFLTGGIARAAVPVFFLINGYFFEPVAQKGGMRAYVLRVLWLYLIWSLLYLPAWFQSALQGDVWRLVRLFAMGWWHLWYLPGLALAAALAAGLRSWPTSRQIAVVMISFMCGVGIVYAMAIGLLQPSKQVFGDMTVLHRNGLFLGLPFLLTGMLIRRHSVEARFSLPVLATISLVSLALLVGEGVLLRSAATGLANHDNLLTLGLASPAIFLLALKFTAQSRSDSLGIYANGLFFVHVAFCVLGFRILQWPKPWIFTLAVFGSVAVTAVLMRSRWGRRLL